MAENYIQTKYTNDDDRTDVVEELMIYPIRIIPVTNCALVNQLDDIHIYEMFHLKHI